MTQCKVCYTRSTNSTVSVSSKKLNWARYWSRFRSGSCYNEQQRRQPVCGSCFVLTFSTHDLIVTLIMNVYRWEYHYSQFSWTSLFSKTLLWSRAWQCISLSLSVHQSVCSTSVLQSVVQLQWACVAGNQLRTGWFTRSCCFLHPCSIQSK
jgi:hypothetical protein